MAGSPQENPLWIGKYHILYPGYIRAVIQIKTHANNEAAGRIASPARRSRRAATHAGVWRALLREHSREIRDPIARHRTFVIIGKQLPENRLREAFLPAISVAG